MRWPWKPDVYFDFGCCCCCCCCNCCNCWKICCGVSTPLGDCGLPGTVDGGGALLGAAPGSSCRHGHRPSAESGGLRSRRLRRPLDLRAGRSGRVCWAFINGGSVIVRAGGEWAGRRRPSPARRQHQLHRRVPRVLVQQHIAARPIQQAGQDLRRRARATLPKTRWSATPPVIFIPVCRDTSRRIWFRLESSARIVSCPPE